MNIIRLIISNIKSNKLKYTIIIISISISIGSIMLITNVVEIGQSIIQNKLNESGVNNILLSLKNNKFKDQEDLNKVKENINNIESISPVYMKQTEIEIRENKENVFIWGINNETENIVGTKPIYGRGINKNDIFEQKMVCVIDKKVSLKFYGRENIVGKKIKVKLNNKVYEVEVIGVMDASQNIINLTLSSYLESFIYMPFSTMKYILNEEGFKSISISLKDNEKKYKTEKELNNFILNTYNETPKIESFIKGLELIYSIINITKIILTLISSISMIIAGFMIMIVMINNINENKNEISLKKAIGASDIDILKEFIFQSIIICIISFILSSFVVISFLYIVITYLKINFHLNLKIIFFIFITSISTGIIFGAYPAYKASKLNPCEGLLK